MSGLAFITATRIGDAVLSTGLLAALIERQPGMPVTVACGPPAASLFAGVPGLEQVIVVDKERFDLHWLRLWRRLVGRRWDLVVDLRGSLVAWTLRADRRLVLRRAGEARHRVSVAGGLLGRADAPPAPTLWPLERHRARAAELIPDGGPVVALAPTANWVGKRWPIERFTELAERLSGRVAVFAAPEERADVTPLLSRLAPERRLEVIGEPDLLTVAAALARCRLFVGNDSGLMHMAAAVGIPTVGLFGPSSEVMYAPWGAHAVAVRGAEDYDAIHRRRRRGDVDLMAGLTVERVLAAIDGIVKPRLVA